MSETLLQSAQRWRTFWFGAMNTYGRMCAEALSENDLKYALLFSRKYQACRKRFREAWVRELVASGKEAPSEMVDWFGER